MVYIAMGCTYLHFKVFIPERQLDVCVSVCVVVQATRLPVL